MRSQDRHVRSTTAELWSLPGRLQMRKTISITGTAARAAVSILWAACILQFASTAAHAQCSARDVLQKQLQLKMRVAEAPEQPVTSDRDVATWKTITLGSLPDPLKLRNKLDSMG